MISLGTPHKNATTKLMLLGSGELGKEVAIEAQRFGLEVIAVDRYPNAPAMQIAQRSHVITMTDPIALESIIRKENPNFIVPEVEAIATEVLLKLEMEGYNIIPTAKSTFLTMNREGIRELASKELGISTSRYFFASSPEELTKAANHLGFPCVIKPIMSSSGKGQKVIHSLEEIDESWNYAITNARGDAQKIIVEEFIEFDYEITLLTIRHSKGITYCPPIGHIQIDGDYRESWQPHPMSEKALNQAQIIAKQITDALGGKGLFGVEFFIKNESVIFSEISPRPHDTGLVTLISQDLSEFALHVRAILGFPIHEIHQFGPSASCAIVAEGTSENIQYEGIEDALSLPETGLRIFGKPDIDGHRRLGVALAIGKSIEEAREKARLVASQVNIIL